MATTRSFLSQLSDAYTQVAADRSVPPNGWWEDDTLMAVVGQQQTTYLWFAELRPDADVGDAQSYRVLRLDPQYTDPRRQARKRQARGRPPAQSSTDRELQSCRYLLGDVQVAPLPAHAGRALRQVQEAFAPVRTAPLRTGQIRSAAQLRTVYQEWF